VQSQQISTYTWVSSSSNPSAPGQSVTFTANVSGMSSGTPTGTVTFSVDGTPVDIEQVSPGSYSGQGQASFTTSALLVGTHQVTAVYSGDTSFAGSSSYPITQTVQLATTSTYLIVNPSTAAPGQAITFTADVSGSNAGALTGSVTFYAGTVELGSVTLLPSMAGQAVLTISTLAVGTYQVTAVYSGDTADAGSSSAPLTVTVQAASTMTSLNVGQGTATLGQPITFTATVTGSGGNTPTGTVTFLDGQNGPVLGIADLVFGMMGEQATLTISTLTMGDHDIFADYNGDMTDASSWAGPAAIVITS
jgi:hypothetical protein